LRSDDSAEAEAFGTIVLCMAAGYTNADLAYIRANYLTLAELCAGRAETPDQVEALIEERLLPRPSYVLDDGTGMFPADYFHLVDEAGGPAALPLQFARRHRAASLAAGTNPDDLEDDWSSYVDGLYGVCLREVTPETIVRKSFLVSSLCQLLVLARPQTRDWRESLRSHVEELDALEREFAPDYDRESSRFERPPTRDLLIDAARDRFPDVFTGAARPARTHEAA
jgi:hypothetical protein